MVVPLGNPKECQSSNSIYHALSSYLPPHVMAPFERSGLPRETTDIVPTVDYVRPLFESSEMKRYGSPEELAENLRIWRNFTGAHRELESDHCRVFNTPPFMYESTDENKFICKQDMVIQLQFLLLSKLKFVDSISLATLVSYLKTQEEKLKACFEFVPADYVTYEKVEKCLDELIHEKSLRYVHDPSYEHTVKGILRKIKRHLPGWSDKNCAAISNRLRELWKMNKSREWFKNLLLSIKIMMDVAKEVIEKNEAIFLPNSLTPNIEKQLAVRLFEDGDKRYCIEKELAGCVHMKESTGTLLRTLSEEEVKKRTRGYVSLLVTPIVRAKHCAQPIRNPGEGYCKLAVDLFLEVLQDIIFGVKIFQRLKPSEWTQVEQFFEKLEHHFNPSEKSPYFIRMADFNKDKAWRLKFFNSFCDRPVREFGSAGANGFTLKDLKKALMDPVLMEMFPEIMEAAEVVFEDFRQNGKIFKTSDLYDAFEQCLLICLFKRLPKLATFLHNQNGCHRVIGMTCCSKPATIIEPRFSNTTLKSIRLEDVDIHILTCPEDLPKKMTCPGGLELFYCESAYCHFVKRTFPEFADPLAEVKRRMHLPEDIPKTVFLIDSDERECLYEIMSLDQHTDRMTKVSQALNFTKNLVQFSSIKPDKKLYLRTFSWNPLKREEERKAFVEEVFEIVKVALKQQGDKMNYQLVETIKNQWLRGSELVNVTQINQIFEKFNIDKSKITLVPDIHYAFSSLYQLPLNTGSPTSAILGSNREERMVPSQAIYRIFEAVVLEIDWNNQVFPSTNYSNKAFRKEILEVMRKCSEFNGFVPNDWLSNSIKNLRENPNYLERKEQPLINPHINLFDCDFSDTICLMFFSMWCEALLGLSGFSDEVQWIPSGTLPVWRARLFFQYTWAQIFFGSDPLKDVVNNGIYLRTPFLNWGTDSEQDFMDVILGRDAEKCQFARRLALKNKALFGCEPVQCHPWLNNHDFRDQMCTNRREQRKQPKGRPLTDEEEEVEALRVQKKTYEILMMLMESSNPKQEDFQLKDQGIDEEEEEKPEDSQESAENENKENVLVVSKSQKKQKDKRKDKLGEPILASSEQKTSQSLEPKSRNPDESANCEKCSRTGERCDEVTKERDAAIRREERLMKKLEACQKANEKLREQMEGMVLKEELEKKAEELDEVVKSGLEKEQEHQAQIEEWEARLQEANSTIDQLTGEKSKLEAYNSDTHRIFQALRNQLPKETLASLDIRSSLEVRDILWDLRDKQDKIISTNPIEQANRKVARLMRLTDDPEVLGRANYDFVEFQTEFSAYEKRIAENIALIQSTPFITKPEIPSVPEEPDLHPRFYNILREAQEAKNEELENECMICKNVHDEWLLCPGCNKKFGIFCIHEWFDTINRRKCPHCEDSIPE